MDAQGIGSGGLQPFGELRAVPVIFPDTAAEFDRDGKIHRLFHGGYDPSRQRRIAHQGAALTVVKDLRHRTAHVDVNEVRMADVPGTAGRFRHHLRLVPKQLGAAGPVRRLHFQQSGGFFIVIDQRFGADHLRIGHGCAELSAHRPKGRVRNARHRRQKKTVFGPEPAKISHVHPPR